jgi:hypothetical protein
MRGNLGVIETKNTIPYGAFIVGILEHYQVIKLIMESGNWMYGGI